MNYTVYMHVNKSNNKKYVGITSQRPKQRWRNNGEGYKKQIFWRAIEKYGWSNIDHIIVAQGLDEETAKWLETQMIAVHDTTNPDRGYNVTLGGEGYNGCKVSEETRRKLSEAAKGRVLTEEHKQNISAAKSGANNPASRKVRCIETGQIYDSAREASKALGKDKSAVTNSIRHNHRCGGYYWEYIS